MSDGLSESQGTVDDQCINTIRTLSMDAIQKANSGHPGAPMGLAPAAAEQALLKARQNNPEVAEDLEVWVRSALRGI